MENHFINKFKPDLSKIQSLYMTKYKNNHVIVSHLDYMETEIIFLLYFNCVISLNGETSNKK